MKRLTNGLWRTCLAPATPHGKADKDRHNVSGKPHRLYKLLNHSGELMHAQPPRKTLPECFSSVPAIGDPSQAHGTSATWPAAGLHTHLSNKTSALELHLVVPFEAKLRAC